MPICKAPELRYFAPVQQSLNLQSFAGADDRTVDQCSNSLLSSAQYLVTLIFW